MNEVRQHQTVHPSWPDFSSDIESSYYRVQFTNPSLLLQRLPDMSI